MSNSADSENLVQNSLSLNEVESNRQNDIGKSWADAAIIFLEKLGVPSFLLIASIVGYFFFQSEYSLRLAERDKEVQRLSSNLSSLNEQQLKIAKAAMDINSLFVESTNKSFKELEEVRSKLVSSEKLLLEANQIKLAASKKEQLYNELNNEHGELSSKHQQLREEFEKQKKELITEKDKGAKINDKVQELAASVLSNGDIDKTRDLASNLKVADQNMAKQLIADYSSSSATLLSMQNILGLELSKLREIIADESTYLQWASNGEYVYGVTQISENSFENILRFGIKNNKVDRIDMIKEISVITDLVKKENILQNTDYVSVLDEYDLSAIESYNSLNKQAGSTWNLIDVLSIINSYPPTILKQKPNEKLEIKSMSNQEFTQKHSSWFDNDPSYALEDFIFAQKSTQNKRRFKETLVAKKLFDQPESLKVILENAAKGELTLGSNLSESEQGRIGWALVAEGSSLISTNTQADDNGDKIITLSINYPRSTYDKEILNLEFSAKTQELKIM
jgi:hypothetical protein